MSKIRTEGELQDRLDEELAWRVKELSNIKIAMKNVDGVAQTSIVRAMVCLTYAHWEGFIKTSSAAYILFVKSQKLSYSDLASCFVAIGVKSKLRSLFESHATLSAIATVDFMRDGMNDRAIIQEASAVSTKSNLSSTVFANIAVTIGIDPTPFESRYNQIDEGLVKRRNRIAHGEFLDIGITESMQLTDDIITLMRQFKTAVENAVAMGTYRK